MFAFIVHCFFLISEGYDFPVAEQQAASGKTVVVTGAAGFIGSHVAQHCLDLGFQVIAVDDLSGGFKSNIPKHAGLTFLQGDVREPFFVEKIFAQHGKVDFVYHLAAYAAEGLSHFIRSYNYRTNLVASMELLNQAVKHKVSCFVFTSSIAVYGSINDLSQMQNAQRQLNTAHKKGEPLTEEDVPSPEDPYGISKFAVEKDLHAAHALWGTNFVVFRPHNVYGPHQNMFDKYRNVVGIFINQIYHKEPMSIFGDGGQERAFSYIDDVAPTIARAPLVPAAVNQVFNIGADTPYTVATLAREIGVAMGVGKDYPIIKHPARLEVFSAVASHEKVKKFFNPPPTVGLHVGLKRTAEWYNKRGQTYSPVEFAAVEVLAKMPPSWVREDLREQALVTGSRVHTKAIDSDRPDEGVAAGSATKSVLLAITHCCRRVDQTDMLLKNIADLGLGAGAEVMIFEDIVAGQLADYPADTSRYRVRHAMNGPHGLTHLWNMAFRVWKFERPSTDVLLLSNNDVLYAPGCIDTFRTILAARPHLSGKPYALGPLCFDKGCGQSRHQDVAHVFAASFNGSDELAGLPGTLATVQRKVNDPMVRAGAEVQEDVFEAKDLLGFVMAFHRNIIGSGYDFSEDNLFNPATVNVNQEHHLFHIKGLPAGVNTRCFVHHKKGTTLQFPGVNRDDLGKLNFVNAYLIMEGGNTLVICVLLLIFVVAVICPRFRFRSCLTELLARKSLRLEQ